MRQSTLLSHLSSSPQLSGRRTRRTVRSGRQLQTNDSSSDSSDSDIAAIPFEPKPTRVSSGEDDEPEPVVILPPKFQSSPIKRSQRVCTSDEDKEKSRPKVLDVINLEASSEPEDVLPHRRKGHRTAVVDSDEEMPRKKQRLLKGARPLSPEADLLDEVDKSAIINSRMRDRGKKSRYMEQLEKLKRKKQNTSVQGSSSDDEDFAPFEGARPYGDGDGDGDEVFEQEDDFIVEDGDNIIDLPAQFSRNRHRDFSENFKILCQLHVHVALQEPSDREAHMSRRLEDDYFSMARDDLKKKVSGILTQTITSQIWKKNFMRSLSKHPNLALDTLDDAIYHCDACNSSRKSTIFASVSNGPYKELGFELQSGDSSDETNEETEMVRKDFILGRFCAERARLFHAFSHWEYALFKSLEAETHNCSGAKTKDGDAVMEKLVAKKIIDHEFQTLKRWIKRAQNLGGGQRNVAIDND